MGQFDGALLSIRDDQNDKNLREQPAEQMQLLKLFPVRSHKNCDGFRFYGHPESLPKINQSFEEFYLTFRDHLMNGRLKSFFILIIPT